MKVDFDIASAMGLLYRKDMMGTRPATLDETIYPRLELPDWINSLLSPDSSRDLLEEAGVELCVRRGSNVALISATCSGADQLEPIDFQDQVERIYLAMRDALVQLQTRHPIRMWNFLPDIGRPIGDGLDRYMLFNIGRFRAFSTWFGRTQFGDLIATASGVGHRADELAIHCLASPLRGAAVENPRQISAYNYSSRYGPRPPSFARGTIVPLSCALEQRPMLLVGGTASICGERSRFECDVVQQTYETLENLDALVHAAIQQLHRAADASVAPKEDRLFDRFQHLRIYLVRPHDFELVSPLITSAFPNASLEWRRADLCRPELLVEIEGVAELSEHIAMSKVENRSLSNGQSKAAVIDTRASKKSKSSCAKTDMTPS